MTPTASPKSRACWRPFWPVVASTTRSVSCGAPSSRDGDHAAHLGELLHEVRLRVEAAGGVDDDDVAAARRRRVERVVRDGGRVAAALGADEVRARALRPDLELLLRRGAVRVGRGDEDGAAVLGELRGELADRRRLAGAVDADDEDHGGRRARGRASAARRRARRPRRRDARRPPRASSRRTSSAVAGTPTSPAISASSSRSQSRSSARVERPPTRSRP